jgi:adenosylhomocysteine nucleosidase
MIAIVGAMNEEVDALLVYLKKEKTIKLHDIDFHQGTINEREVVVFKSGIGLVMAAMTLTICFEHFKISHLINIGTAGGLDPNQKVLDMVIPDRLTYHDFDITSFGNERNFSSKNRFIYSADKVLLESFRSLVSQQRVWYGPLVSDNQFINTQAQFDEIKTHYPEAQACEMEGAALANVASEYKIPFIIIRSLSDIVLHSDNSMTFSEYLEKASARSASLCFEFCGKLKI